LWKDYHLYNQVLYNKWILPLLFMQMKHPSSQLLLVLLLKYYAQPVSHSTDKVLSKLLAILWIYVFLINQSLHKIIKLK
jgi:hypothetical protein